MEPHRAQWRWLALVLPLLGLIALGQRGFRDATPSASPPSRAPPWHSPRLPHRKDDPLLRAAAAPGTNVVVLLEVSALRHSLAGQLLLDCLASLDAPDDGPSLALGDLREQGLDLLQDLDRVAFVDGTVMGSGDFSRVNWDTLLPLTQREAYGADGQLRSFHDKTTSAEVPTFATWGSKLALVARTRAAARAALDRVEGGSPTEVLLGESQAYGDLYGVLRGSVLGFAFGRPNAPLSAQLQSAARRVEFNLDATRDLRLVARVQGDDPGRLRELGQALTEALAQQPTAEGLDGAQVTVGERQVDVEVTIPLAVLRRQLAATCGQDGGAPH